MVGSGQYGFMIRGNLVQKVQQIKFCTGAGQFQAQQQGEHQLAKEQPGRKRCGVLGVIR